MEIGSTAPGTANTTEASLRNTGSTAASAQNVGDADADDNETGGASAEAVSQDDAVQISQEGYTAASDGSDNYSDDDGSDYDITVDVSLSPQSSSDASDTSNASDVSQASNADGQTADPASAQPVRSLVYGALGLERPDGPTDPNHAYTMGRWLAAGLTVGGIISLFV